LPTYGKEEARADFRKAWDILEEIKGLEWCDRLAAIDRYFEKAMRYDTSAKLYWDEERAYQHLQWLKDFNKRFLEKPPDNDKEELPDGK